MQFTIDELNLGEDEVCIKDTLEDGSACRTLLFGDTESFDEEGVAIKITRDIVYLTINGLDDADEIIKAQWAMDRNKLIEMLLSVEGH